MKYLLSILLAFLLSAIPAFSQRDVNSVSDRLFDLRKEGRYEEAILDLNNLIKESPNDPKLYIKRAEFFGKQKKFDEAIADLNIAISIEPDNAQTYINRANYFRMTNNNRAVLKDVQTAFSLNPKNSGVFEDGERELRAIKQYEEIIKLADKLIEDKQSLFTAYQIRAQNRFQLGNYSETLDDILKAAETEPFNNRFRYSLVYDSLDKLKADKSIIGFYHKVSDTFKKIQKNLAANHYKIPFYTSFPSVFLEGTIRDYSERSIKVSFMLADLYEVRGEAEKAKEILENIVKIEPENIAYIRRSDYYRSKGRLDEAERDRIKDIELRIERITKKLDSDTLDSPKADVLINRGKLYLSINQYDKAIVDFEMAKLIDGKVVLLADNLIDLAKQKMQESGIQPK